MNAFTRTLRTSSLRLPRAQLSTLSARPQRLTRPPTLLNALGALQHARGAASNVSGRPGSQTLEHAAQNIKEEVGQSAADVARAIAGGNMTADAVAPSEQTFVSFLFHRNKAAYMLTKRRSWE